MLVATSAASSAGARSATTRWTRARQGPAAEQHRPGALIAIGSEADGQDHQPGVAHRRDQADQGGAAAAMIGTPGGVKGTRARAIPAPRSAAVDRARLSSCSDSSARKSAGNAASSPSADRVAERLAADDADDRARDPRQPEHDPGADQAIGIERPLALRGDRPRLVDDQLA